MGVRREMKRGRKSRQREDCVGKRAGLITIMSESAKSTDTSALAFFHLSFVSTSFRHSTVTACSFLLPFWFCSEFMKASGFLFCCASPAVLA